ncbi:MAG: GntR family transcriptional regulator [Victivallaceae bacterium]|nr:GntR family transcriptional regulator [Victivallaceae bacterium]
MKQNSSQFARARQGIISHIRQNRLSGGDKLPSIRAFAGEFCISPLTIQKAIGSLISQGILTAKVGSGTYVAPSGKRLYGDRVIGILMSPFLTIENNFLSEIFQGIKTFLDERGYRAILMQYSSGEIEKEEIAALDAILQQKINGMIANFNSPADSVLWSRLEQENIPLVCVNNLSQKHLFCGVTTNNFAGGILAAKTLYEYGHRNIAIAANNIRTLSVDERISGFRDYLKNCSVEIDPANLLFIRPGHSLAQEVGCCIDALLQNRRRPSAVFAINDGIAAEFILQLSERKVRIPEEISIIGFDNNDVCRFLTPQLTTIRQPAYEMGRRAAEIVLNLIDNKNSSELLEVSLKPELIIRNSIKKITPDV